LPGCPELDFKPGRPYKLHQEMARQDLGSILIVSSRLATHSGGMMDIVAYKQDVAKWWYFLGPINSLKIASWVNSSL